MEQYDHWSVSDDECNYGGVWSNEYDQWNSSDCGDAEFVGEDIDESDCVNDDDGRVGDGESSLYHPSVHWSNRTGDSDRERSLSNNSIDDYGIQWSTLSDDWDTTLECGNNKVFLEDSYDQWSCNYDDDNDLNEHVIGYDDDRDECVGNLTDILGTSSSGLEQWSCHCDDENECDNYGGADYGHDKDHESPSENAFAGEGDRNCEWSINFNDDDRDYSDYAHSGQGVVLSNAWSSNYDNNIGNCNDDNATIVTNVGCTSLSDDLESNDFYNETIKTAHSCVPTCSYLSNAYVCNGNNAVVHLKTQSPQSCSRRSFLVNNDLVGMIIQNTFEKWRMKDDYLQVVNGLRLKLEDQLRMLYRHSCQLTVFGSLLNGFGISGSDIDASLTFVSFQRDDQPDSTAVITELTDVLPQISEVTEVQPIPNARVPVVKFIYKDVLGCFQFDLSYDNKLAIENTSLLRAYNTVDKRVTQLGIMLKRWSEYCEIKDASCGRLSSYALCIMLIHFLQTTEPPVLPFLQQVKGRSRAKTKRIVDGFDVYFCKADDLTWKTRNVDSVSSLWLNFLDYFGSKFDFENDIIQIRINKRLKKAAHKWANKPMTIEDPFKLAYNLSFHVRAETLDYIKRSFQRGYQQFKRLQEQTEVSRDDRSIDDIVIKLLQSCRIGDGPPNDQKRCNGVH